MMSRCGLKLTRNYTIVLNSSFYLTLSRAFVLSLSLCSVSIANTHNIIHLPASSPSPLTHKHTPSHTFLTNTTTKPMKAYNLLNSDWIAMTDRGLLNLQEEGKEEEEEEALVLVAFDGIRIRIYCFFLRS